ncbi:Tc5 transposase DNA-binding domain [Popillia japonica]|uniref:Tc5 transposase DNA-binding domain n=1 Tax=Popillia japonica TaxID=7064 RepID=A0AAW1NJC1_POPJA
MEKAEEFGHPEFKCSGGWLDRFKLRHGISFGKISGEAKSVNLQETEKLLTNVWPKLQEGYKDETFLTLMKPQFFDKLLLDRTLKYKKEKCIGGKLA